MHILNLQTGTPFSMGKGKNWSILNPDTGAERITLNHGLHAPGQEFTQHLHDESEDVILVLEGWVNLRQGEVYTRLEAGEAALVPAGEVHGTVNSSGKEARLISFQLPPDLVLYRGERNHSGDEIPKPTPGTLSAVQIVSLKKGSPAFPGIPSVRNVFSPAKGSRQAKLDAIHLEPGHQYDYRNGNTETVFVLLEGSARLQGEEQELSRHDVVLLNQTESISFKADTKAASLICCSSVTGADI